MTETFSFIKGERNDMEVSAKYPMIKPVNPPIST